MSDVADRGEQRDFTLLWFGEGVSLLGGMTTTAVLPLIAATQFNASPEWMGLLAAATWLPWLLFGLPIGAWVDRSDPRRIMIGADVIGALAIVMVPILWALDHLGLPHLIAAELGAGLSAVLLRTALAAIIPRLVGPAGLERANSRLLGTESAMQVAGPGIGGVLMQALSGSFVLLLDVVGYLVSAVCLARIRRDTRPDPNLTRQKMRTEIRHGIRTVFGDRFLRYHLITNGLSNLGLTGYTALVVLFMVRDLRLDPAQVGLLMAIGSAGGLVGAAVAVALGRRWGTARASIAFGLLTVPAALVIPLASPGWGVLLLAGGSLGVSAGAVAGNVLRAAFRQRWVPQHLLGRVSGTATLVTIGTMPVAGVLAGWLGGVIGVVPTMALMVGVHALTELTLVTPLCPFARLRDFPIGPMPLPSE